MTIAQKIHGLHLTHGLYLREAGICLDKAAVGSRFMFVKTCHFNLKSVIFRANEDSLLADNCNNRAAMAGFK